jgi:hypothetical protein
MEHLTDLDPAANDVLTRRVDVGDEQLQTLSGAGLGCQSYQDFSEDVSPKFGYDRQAWPARGA